MFCRPNSLIISRSLLCLLAVLLLVICFLLQLISGRLKSLAMTTFGGFLVFYVVLSEIHARLQAIGDGH